MAIYCCIRHSPDEGVNLRGLNIVQLLNSILDLTLVRLDVNDENESVVLLNLLHRRLRVKWPGFPMTQSVLLGLLKRIESHIERTKQ